MPTASSTPTPFIGQVSIEHAQIIYYDITGSTASELRVSMNKSRPKDPYDGNKPVDAYTDWYISWNWPGYGTDHCDLSAAVVEYKIKVFIPRWNPPAEASSQLIAKWEKYIESLVLHEKGHVENIFKNYLSVKTAIQSATCSTAEAAAQKALEPLRKFDSSYDRETKHGMTQGAVFP
jgi:predicted secreted Zn-dependent protease